MSIYLLCQTSLQRNISRHNFPIFNFKSNKEKSKYWWNNDFNYDGDHTVLHGSCHLPSPYRVAGTVLITSCDCAFSPSLVPSESGNGVIVTGRKSQP